MREREREREILAQISYKFAEPSELFVNTCVCYKLSFMRNDCRKKLVIKV